MDPFAPDDPGPFRVKQGNAITRLRDNWDKRLPQFVGAGVPLEQVRPMLAYDLRRVQRGSEPLSDRETALGMAAMLGERQVIPEPQDEGLSGLLTAPLEDLRHIISTLPQLPGAMVEEAKALPTAAQKLSEAIYGPGDLGEKAQAVSEVPGIRMLPGVYTATRLAQGPEGVSELAHHPVTTALDVLPIMHSTGATAAIGKRLEPLAERLHRWQAEHGGGGPEARQSAATGVRAARAAGKEYRPIEAEISRLAEGTTEEQRMAATFAAESRLPYAQTPDPEGLAQAESRFPGVTPHPEWKAGSLPEMPDEARPLLEYQEGELNPKYQERLIETGQAAPYSAAPNLRGVLDEALGDAFADEVLPTSDVKWKNLSARGRRLDQQAQTLTAAEEKLAHSRAQADKYRRDWEGTQAQYEALDIYPSEAEAASDLFRSSVDWREQAGRVLDTESKVEREVLSEPRPWPKRVAPLRPGEERFLAGDTTASPMRRKVTQETLNKTRLDPNIDPDLYIFEGLEPRFPLGGPSTRRWSKRLMDLEDQRAAAEQAAEQARQRMAAASSENPMYQKARDKEREIRQARDALSPGELWRTYMTRKDPMTRRGTGVVTRAEVPHLDTYVAEYRKNLEVVSQVEDAVARYGGPDSALGSRLLEGEQYKTAKAAADAAGKNLSDLERLMEAAEPKRVALDAQLDQFRQSPAMEAIRQLEREYNGLTGEVDKIDDAIDAERQRVNNPKRKADIAEVVVDADPREVRLGEIYEILDRADEGRGPYKTRPQERELPAEARQALEAEAAALEADGVAVRPSDRKMKVVERDPKVQEVGQKRFERREQFVVRLFGDGAGRSGLIDQAAAHIAAGDAVKARRALKAAKRINAKAIEDWPEYAAVAGDVDARLANMQAQVMRSGIESFRKKKAHHEERIAREDARSKVLEGRVLSLQDTIKSSRRAMVKTVQGAPPARFRPLLGEVITYHAVGKAGAAEKMAAALDAIPADHWTRSLGEQIAAGKSRVDPGMWEALKVVKTRDPAGFAALMEVDRYRRIIDQRFSPADLRRALVELKGVDHPGVAALSRARPETLEAVSQLKAALDKALPEFQGRRNAEARLGALDEARGRIWDLEGEKAGRAITDFFEKGYDKPPGDYILPGDKAIAEALKAGDFENIPGIENIKQEVARTWTTMRDVYGFDPVFIHHLDPKKAKYMNLASVSTDRVVTPTQARQRSILGAPFESDISVAMRHQAYEWVNREHSLNAMFGHYDTVGQQWVPGIFSPKAEGGHAFTFDQVVEAHAPEINARAKAAGVKVLPDGDMENLAAWLASPDGAGYRVVAKGYLEDRFAKVKPFDLMNFGSGGLAPRGSKHMREIVRFDPDGNPYTMEVPDEVWVPKSVQKVLDFMTSSKKGPSSLYAAYDKGMDVFRMSALAFSPRFHLYNVVGGAILAFLRTGPDLIKHLGAAREAVGSLSESTGAAHPGLSTGSLVAPTITTAFSEASRSTSRLAVLSRIDKGGVLGRLWKNLKGGAEWSFSLGEWVDNIYRSAVYMYGKEKAAKALGVNEAELSRFLRTREVDLGTPDWGGIDESVLEPGHLKALGEMDYIQKSGIKLANKVLQDWDSMLPWERHILRNIFPFYGWMRHIFTYVGTFPIDHPYRAYFLSTFARNEQDDRKDPLGDRFHSIFWLGEPGDDGKQMTLNLAGANPFTAFGDMFTWAGFVSQLSPVFQAGLEMSGVDMMTASSQLYPELTYDPESGRLTAVRRGAAETLLGAFVPQSEALLGATGFSKSMRELAESDPDAWRSRIATSLGVPFSPRYRSKTEEVTKAEVARSKAAAGAVGRAIKSGEWGEADKYQRSFVNLTGKEGDERLANVEELKQSILALQARAQQERLAG